MENDPVARLSQGPARMPAHGLPPYGNQGDRSDTGDQPGRRHPAHQDRDAILGVQRRRDAALLLAQYEGTQPYPSLVYPPRDIAIAPHPATLTHH